MKHDRCEITLSSDQPTNIDLQHVLEVPKDLKSYLSKHRTNRGTEILNNVRSEEKMSEVLVNRQQQKGQNPLAKSGRAIMKSNNYLEDEKLVRMIENLDKTAPFDSPSRNTNLMKHE